MRRNHENRDWDKKPPPKIGFEAKIVIGVKIFPRETLTRKIFSEKYEKKIGAQKDRTISPSS